MFFSPGRENMSEPEYREDQRCQGFSCDAAPLGCSDSRFCPRANPPGTEAGDEEQPPYEIICDTCAKRDDCPDDGYPTPGCPYVEEVL